MTYDEDDYDRLFDEDYDIDFAEPGSGSALRAATRDNPRDRPCPRCEREDVLTREDVARHYVCDHCADIAEGRIIE